ncbi:hypothetical protein WJX74_000977 [Apatococcus lobatus]|uniref:Uncharacterized protein n=1 Tax=Apatococcus lobatus TaxID=904363 RepID=A0AAW1SA79_9CHLO
MRRHRELGRLPAVLLYGPGSLCQGWQAFASSADLVLSGTGRGRGRGRGNRQSPPPRAPGLRDREQADPHRGPASGNDGPGRNDSRFSDARQRQPQSDDGQWQQRQQQQRQAARQAQSDRGGNPQRPVGREPAGGRGPSGSAQSRPSALSRQGQQGNDQSQAPKPAPSESQWLERYRANNPEGGRRGPAQAGNTSSGRQSSGNARPLQPQGRPSSRGPDRGREPSMAPSAEDATAFAGEDPDDMEDAGFASNEDRAGSRRRERPRRKQSAATSASNAEDSAAVDEPQQQSRPSRSRRRLREATEGGSASDDLQGRMDNVEMEVEDKDLPRKAMGARVTGHAANQRRAVMRGEPAFDGSQRTSSWSPPEQVKRAEARAEQAWFNYHPDRHMKDTHFMSDLLADVDNELDPHFNFDVSRTAPRRHPMRTAEDVEQMLEECKPEIMERMGLTREAQWQAHVDHALQAVPFLIGVAEDLDYEGQEDKLVAEFQGKLSAQSAEGEDHLKLALETIRSNPFWTHEQKTQFMNLSIQNAN